MNNKTTLSSIVPLTKEDAPANNHFSLQHRVATVESPAVIVNSTSDTEQPPFSIENLASAIDPRASSPHMRNGKIARLPKPERDMVNRMLHNHVPYPKIAGCVVEAKHAFFSLYDQVLL